MKHLTLQEIGKIVRKVRKERGLRLEDLADENISPATVSNIERGIAHVSPEKISYLLKKLHLSKHQLPEILSQEKKDLNKLNFTFLMVSSLCELGYEDEALKQLNELKLRENHPFIAKVYYYKGCCFFNKKKWKQAERAFFQALRYTKQNKEALINTNLEAACYLYLGCSQYKQKNFEQALSYFDLGIESFHHNGDRQYVKYQLYLNKIECLKKLQRITEGNQLLHKIWNSVQNIQDIRTIIHFYALRSEFAQKAGLYDEAIHFATNGIKLASRNNQVNLLLNLWTSLGNLYMMCGEWNLSESCFQMVLQRKNDPSNDNKRVSSYLQLGILYMKQKKFQRAYQSLQHALQYADSKRYSKQFTLCLLVIGDLCFSMGKSDEALYYFQKGQKITEQNEDPKRELQFWMRMAQYWEKKDQKEFQKCIEHIYQLQKNGFTTTNDYEKFLSI